MPAFYFALYAPKRKIQESEMMKNEKNKKIASQDEISKE